MASFIVLFEEGFWAASMVAEGQNGWDLVYGFFSNIGASETWGSTSAHFLVYGVVIFTAMIVFTASSLALVFIMNFGMFGRSRRLYRNGGWLGAAVVVMIGFYVWHLVTVGSFSSASVWFWVLGGIGILAGVATGVFRLTETNN